MDILKDILIFLHILGAVAIVGGWFATFKKPTVLPVQLYGAIAQLVTGLALVGILGATHEPVNYYKITVKLLIAIVVLVAAVIGYRKAASGAEVPKGLAHAVGGMALINIAVATLWS
jgi:hypothetical protein